jgi:hypothetical protein
MPATLAKSLHTVSVLVNVAREAMRVADDSGRRFPDGVRGAVDAALIILGYEGAADPYGLAAKAVAQLEKEAAKPASSERRANPYA